MNESGGVVAIAILIMFVRCLWLTFWYEIKPTKRNGEINKGNNYYSDDVSDGELFWYNDNHGDIF